MKIGYARVSSNNQDLELQKEELLKAGCKKIYSESVSAKNNNRAELMAMIESLRPDDIVVVYKIDRIARSLKCQCQLKMYQWFAPIDITQDELVVD